MINRRNLLKAISALGMAAPHVSRVSAQEGTSGRIDAQKKGVMLMNRIGPSASELSVANANGTGERKFLQNSVFEHNASFAPDGSSVLFTSERNGAGQSDVFRARLDGTGIEAVATGPAVEDQATLSPDGTRVAFISTREGYRANVWVLDLKNGTTRNLTGAEDVQGDPSGPNGFFRPAWSPNNRWLAFSSDRNTDWRGHDDGQGWEHTQELSVYVIRADGRGFRRIASKPGYRLSQVVARRQARCLLRNGHGGHVGCTPAESCSQGCVADRIGRHRNWRADRAHIGAGPEGVSAIPERDGNCLSPQGRSRRRTLLHVRPACVQSRAALAELVAGRQDGDL
jgi:dipeptidyl aminopeptidase/acylaminoacyl peptidase